MPSSLYRTLNGPAVLWSIDLCSFHTNCGLKVFLKHKAIILSVSDVIILNLKRMDFHCFSDFFEGRW